MIAHTTTLGGYVTLESYGWVRHLIQLPPARTIGVS